MVRKCAPLSGGVNEFVLHSFYVKMSAAAHCDTLYRRRETNETQNVYLRTYIVHLSM